MFEVLTAGLLTTPQDLGRPGHAAIGVGRAGAADPVALQLANALVGNAAGACALEMTLQGPVLEAHSDAWVALVGAPLPQARIDERALPMGMTRRIRAGERLMPGSMPAGCRSYLAVAGGFVFEPWLGSRSCDVNAGLGPAPIRPGMKLRIGEPAVALPDAPAWGLDSHAWSPGSGVRRLRLLRASHTGQLDEPSLKALTTATFTIHADSNRVGSRLDGPRLHLRKPIDIITTGSVAGSMQLPPGGQPIVLGCEHPVTGGYPRIGQLIEADLPRLAQCRPGDRLSFEWIDMAAALDAKRQQQQLIEQTRWQIRQRLEQRT